MPRSYDSFGITLPADHALGRLVELVPPALGLIVGALLAATLDGLHGFLAALPLCSGLIAYARVRRRMPLPETVRFCRRTGWRLCTGGETVTVHLDHGSYLGRYLLLLAFRHADGSRWLVLLARGVCDSDHWRRLRVLWRTTRSSLVANPPNC